MEKNFLSMELIYSTKDVQFDKLNNYIIPFKFTNFNSTKKRIFHLSSRNGDQKRFSRMRGTEEKKDRPRLRGSSRTRSSDRASATRFLRVARAKFTLQDIGKERAE